jgi:hypothetical protein
MPVLPIRHPMKATIPSFKNPGRMPRSASGLIALLLGAGLIPISANSAAQSTESLAKPAPETAGNKPAPKEKPAAPANFKPMDTAVAIGMASRFVSQDDLGPYIKAMTETFAMRDRATDPFGQPQDPDAKPVVKAETTKKSTRVTQLKATPFSEIVRLIKVTTVMPGEKRFLIGTRSIREGQKLPINFRSKPISVLVVSVSSSRILLQNLDTNETATLDMNLLPVGMTQGTKGINAPGMVQDSPNAAIDLENDGLPDQQTANP